jgi:hypothetical protein
MTVDRASTPAASRTALADTLLDGLFTGMIGALVVAIWFLVLDAVAGRPLYTPALLGGVLLHGAQSVAQQVPIAPTEIAAYTAFHFVAFIAVGIVLSWLMTLFEKFPIMFFVLLVLFVCLQVGFFALDVAMGAELLGRLRPWTVLTANVLAAASMALYQWRRHPGVVRGIENLWTDDSRR